MAEASSNAPAEFMRDLHATLDGMRTGAQTWLEQRSVLIKQLTDIHAEVITLLKALMHTDVLPPITPELAAAVDLTPAPVLDLEAPDKVFEAAQTAAPKRSHKKSNGSGGNGNSHLHWTQRPENKAKLRRMARQSAATRHKMLQANA